MPAPITTPHFLLQNSRNAESCFGSFTSTVVTVLERSSGSSMLKVSSWPSDHLPTAARTASASSLCRVNTFSSFSSNSMFSAWRRPNSRCIGAVPAYLL